VVYLINLVKRKVLIDLRNVDKVAFTQLEPEDLVHVRVFVAYNALVFSRRYLRVDEDCSENEQLPQRKKGR